MGASTGQLQRNLKQGRYYAVANRLQRYMGCIIDDDNNGSESKLGNDDDSPLAIKVVQLAVTVWESLCRDQALEHKRAYKRAHRLRRSISDCSDKDDGNTSSNNNI